MKKFDFEKASEYLVSLGHETLSINWDIRNSIEIFSDLGNPQKNYLKVQIAGTNGKGSCCEFVESICRAASIKNGIYTSPDIETVLERIRIVGSVLPKQDFAELTFRVKSAVEKLFSLNRLTVFPTYFEQVTAIALLALAEAQVKLGILETGLGGRLDATTAANAELAAITRIDYDHQQYLGDTIEEIAAEKAAIIHEGSRVVIGEQIPEAEKVIRDRCEQFGIDAKFATKVKITFGSGWLNFQTDQADYRVKKLGLLGHHQIENAKVAILLAEELQSHFPITTEHIIWGLENARHPGRLEYQGRYLFDGAHNIGGAKALRNFLDEFEKRPITLVFGAMRDKDVGEIIEILQPKAEFLILTQLDNERAMSAAELERFIGQTFDRQRVFLTPTVGDALAKADEVTGEDGIVLITGSLYLIGEAKKILNN
ncbi:MAG: bifunctional folylpolyglutamate synthase/dihydrofolate synthase [Pyrinomonadaceae bacterium]